ncbi:hypothetical protein LTR37_017703 [Vermiconidia calcicola]|uniref:Uncharacterized protein n=1 Tax=Vermiconidia calcicola TaxID=1690605 RepID=A0ACC3MJB9_9PEZI|nr:hypothetical protein LTR37_017703 [Vermiconidia calcicola]
MPRFDVRDRLDGIKVPALILVGRHDYITPVAQGEEVSKGIPGASSRFSSTLDKPGI